RSEPLPDAHRSALGIDGVGIEAAFLFQLSDDSAGLRTAPSLRHEVLHRLRNLGFAVAGTLWVKIARVIFWRAAMHVVERFLRARNSEGGGQTCRAFCDHVAGFGALQKMRVDPIPGKRPGRGGDG